MTLNELIENLSDLRGNISGDLKVVFEEIFIDGDLEEWPAEAEVTEVEFKDGRIVLR